MPQSVDKLKELLFDSEARALDVLTKRVEGVEHLTLDERRAREGIGQRIDAVFNRVGTSDRFEVSVAEVLDGALRRAEVDRHAELASAMAPLVVRTVKTEIRNSRDELVEALYPMTGRMVKAYVASAMKDLAKDINRKLEQNPVMLRLRSLAAGKSVAEIAIAESQRLEVEELYLIRRGSGELVGRWPDSGDSGRDHAMSGVLTAINEFSTEALKDDGSALRQIDLGERQLYLRVSPSFLLAAKCTGSAPMAVEAVLDDSFLKTMEELQQLTQSGGTVSAKACSTLLGGLSENLTERLDEKTGELATQAAGISPLRMLAWMVGLPLAALLTWMVYADYRTERAHSIASKTLTSVTDLKGYPVSVDVSRLGTEVTLSGLAPAVSVKDELINRVQQALPHSIINDRLSVLPNDLAAVEPRIAGVKNDVKALTPQVEQTKASVEAVGTKVDSVRAKLSDVELQANLAARARSLDRAYWRLNEAKGTLAALEGSLSTPAELKTIRDSAKSVQQALAVLEPVRASPISANTRTAAENSQLSEISGHVRQAEAAVTELAGLGPVAAHSASGNDTSADYIALEADRLAGAALAAAQVIAVKRSLPKPLPPIEPSAREKLVAFSKSNAIFFTNDVDLRTPQQANAALDQLAQLMRGNDVLVRVVGYTDNQGLPDKNTALSEARSNVVVGALKQRGVAASRLVMLGRVDSIGISPEFGASSPNRRVEFEIGFVGENAP